MKNSFRSLLFLWTRCLFLFVAIFLPWDTPFLCLFNNNSGFPTTGGIELRLIVHLLGEQQQCFVGFLVPLHNGVVVSFFYEFIGFFLPWDTHFYTFLPALTYTPRFLSISFLRWYWKWISYERLSSFVLIIYYFFSTAISFLGWYWKWISYKRDLAPSYS